MTPILTLAESTLFCKNMLVLIPNHDSQVQSQKNNDFFFSSFSFSLQISLFMHVYNNVYCQFFSHLYTSHSKAFWAGLSRKYGEMRIKNACIFWSRTLLTPSVCTAREKDLDVSSNKLGSNLANDGSMFRSSWKPLTPIWTKNTQGRTWKQNKLWRGILKLVSN